MWRWHPSCLYVAIFLLVGLVCPATAQPPEGEVEAPDKLRAPSSLVYSWTAPTTGTQVVYYVVEVKVNEEITLQPDLLTGTTFTISDVKYLQKYQIRVAGVDSDGHMGPFSLWSELYEVPELEAPGF